MRTSRYHVLPGLEHNIQPGIVKDSYRSTPLPFSIHQLRASIRPPLPFPRLAERTRRRPATRPPASRERQSGRRFRAHGSERGFPSWPPKPIEKKGRVSYQPNAPMVSSSSPPPPRETYFRNRSELVSKPRVPHRLRDIELFRIGGDGELRAHLLYADDDRTARVWEKAGVVSSRHALG
jgi:hypothetical protein